MSIAMQLVQLDTPPLTPTTPTERVHYWSIPPQLPKKRQLRCPLRTPTKKLATRDLEAAVINFVMQPPLNVCLTPSLTIASTAIGKRKVRRRLWGPCEPLKHIDLEIRKRRRLSLLPSDAHHHCDTTRVEQQLICSLPISYYLGTDADDEMERSRVNDHSPLSPPYSPWSSELVVNCTATDDNVTQSLPIKHHSQAPKVKVCASCKTRKTPLWRDSEDGTPYCNACGIRLRKYHISCSVCHYIPRKDEKLGNSCCLCGSRLVHC